MAIKSGQAFQQAIKNRYNFSGNEEKLDFSTGYKESFLAIKSVWAFQQAIKNRYKFSGNKERLKRLHNQRDEVRSQRRSSVSAPRFKGMT